MTRLRPIRELACQIRGVTYGKDDASSMHVPGSIAVLRAGNIQESGLVLDNLVYVPRARVSEEQLLRRHDVLVATSSGSLDVVGKTAQVTCDLGMAFGAFCKVLRPRPGIEPRYFAHYFRTAEYRRSISRLAAGVNINNLRNEHLDDLLVPVPGTLEQHRIADILDKADAIRRKRKEAIALTEELLRSAFLEMFGDPVTNPKGWPSETIGDLCSRGANLVDGPFGSTLKPEHYASAGVKVVRNWNIYDDRFDATEYRYVTPSKFEEIRRSEVVGGDVLITTKGTVGDVCVAPDLDGLAVLSASGTARLRVPPDGTYLPEFVVAQMIAPSFKRYLHTFEAGSAQQYLNLSAIRKMRLIRPSADRQRAFSRLRERLRTTTGRTNAAYNESDRLFGSLVERSFVARST